MTPPPQLDLATAVTAVFAVLFGPQLAAYVGPYAVIMIGATVGAAWSLGRRPVTSRSKAINYFLLMAFTALILTVPLSEWLGAKLGSEDSRYLFAPVAMFIGGVGSDWPTLVRWLGRRALRLIERRAGVGGDNK